MTSQETSPESAEQPACESPEEHFVTPRPDLDRELLDWSRSPSAEKTEGWNPSPAAFISLADVHSLLLQAYRWSSHFSVAVSRLRERELGASFYFISQSCLTGSPTKANVTDSKCKHVSSGVCYISSAEELLTALNSILQRIQTDNPVCLLPSQGVYQSVLSVIRKLEAVAILYENPGGELRASVEAELLPAGLLLNPEMPWGQRLWFSEERMPPNPLSLGEIQELRDIEADSKEAEAVEVIPGCPDHESAAGGPILLGVCKATVKAAVDRDVCNLLAQATEARAEVEKSKNASELLKRRLRESQREVTALKNVRNADMSRRQQLRGEVFDLRALTGQYEALLERLRELCVQQAMDQDAEEAAVLSKVGDFDSVVAYAAEQIDAWRDGLGAEPLPHFAWNPAGGSVLDSNRYLAELGEVQKLSRSVSRTGRIKLRSTRSTQIPNTDSDGDENTPETEPEGDSVRGKDVALAAWHSSLVELEQEVSRREGSSTAVAWHLLLHCVADIYQICWAATDRGNYRWLPRIRRPRRPHCEEVATVEDRLGKIWRQFNGVGLPPFGSGLLGRGLVTQRKVRPRTGRSSVLMVEECLADILSEVWGTLGVVSEQTESLRVTRWSDISEKDDTPSEGMEERLERPESPFSPRRGIELREWPDIGVRAPAITIGRGI